MLPRRRGGTGLRFEPDDMLLLIDVQPTFMPGGELPVPDGAAILPALNRLLAVPGLLAFATQDWHPPGHHSFASTHPGRAPLETITLPYGTQTLWPGHALQNTPNAALHPDLDQTHLALILRKGANPAIDSYSAFRENDRTTTTGLAAWLHARGIKTLLLAGLALDFCVAWSAEDARDAGFDVIVIEDACRGINVPYASGLGSIAATRTRLTGMGVGFLSEAEARQGLCP